MTNGKLKKVLEQIKTYHLDLVFKTTNQLIEWIFTLDEIQIKNFLSLNIAYQDKFEPFLGVLMNPVLLKSPYFLDDAYYLLNAPTLNKHQLLYDVATSRASIKSIYHLAAMDTLYNCNNLTEFSVYDYAIHGNFILDQVNPYFLEDMNFIASAQTKNKAQYLYETAISYFSLSNKYHHQDMQLIFNADMDFRAYFLGETAKDNVSLNSKFHEMHMDFINRAKTPTHIVSLYNIATSKESLESDNHCSNMKCIFYEENEQTVELLTKKILNFTSENHLDHEAEMEKEISKEEKRVNSVFQQVEKGIQVLEQIEENKEVDQGEVNRILSL